MPATAEIVVVPVLPAAMMVAAAVVVAVAPVETMLTASPRPVDVARAAGTSETLNKTALV